MKPIAARVAGEDPSGSIPAVSRGCESDNQQASLGVAEARHRPAPILLAGEFPFAEPRYFAAMGTKSWAELAGSDTLAQLSQQSSTS
jgi:hypothetical protein